MEGKFYVVAKYDDGNWDDSILIDICDSEESAESRYGDVFMINHWSCDIYNEEDFNDIYEDRKEELMEGYERRILRRVS